MRIGIIRNCSDPASYDFVRDKGMSFMEICCNNTEEANNFIEKSVFIKDNLARTGISLSSVGRWNHTLNKGGTADSAEKEVYFRQLDTAVSLGAKTFVCGFNRDDSVSLYKNLTGAINFFAELIDRANGRIKVAVQNCNWNNFIVSPDEWKIVLGELPDLYLKYDPSHAYSRGANYLAELSDWGDRIAHFHVKGIIRAGRRGIDDPPAGMDDINWPGVFAILYSRHYDGDLSIEPHSAFWHGAMSEKGIDFTYSYIKRFVL